MKSVTNETFGGDEERQNFDFNRFDRSDASDISTSFSEPCRFSADLNTCDLQSRRSLKEAILLRKLQRSQSAADRWSVRLPRGAAPERFERSESIRSKLSKNQEELKNLLSHVPTPVIRSQDQIPGATSNLHDAKNLAGKFIPSSEGPIIRDRTITSNSVRSFSRISTSLNSEDSSSSDEDLREPMAESPPNLSDEDSVGVFHVQSPRPSLRDPVRALQRADHSDASEKSFVSVVRTSSRMYLPSQRKGSNSSSTSDVYEAAKPRPPPRKIHLGKLKPSVQERLQNQANERQHVVVTTQDNQRIVTLPYVSRGTRGSWREVGGNSLPRNIAKLNGYGESPQDASKTIGFQSIVEEAKEDDVVPKPATLPSVKHRTRQSKTDTSPSRLTVSSSGYSSPGSSDGNSSLSPSSSNASSSSSRSLRLPTGKIELGAGGTGVQPIPEREVEEPAIVPRKTDDVALRPAESMTSSNVEEDDIFPVRTWVETPEYREIAQRTNGNDVTTCDTDQLQVDGEVKSEGQMATRSVSARETHKRSSPVLDASKRKSLPPMRSGITSYVDDTASVQDEQDHDRVGKMPFTNMISMVEDRTPRTLKLQSRAAASSASIKMRFPVGGRSKKAAASRNSRAFAMQASSAVTSQTEARQPPVDVAPKELAMEPEKDPRRTTSLSPGGRAQQEVASLMTEPELSASLAQLDKIGSAIAHPRNYNTVSGATGRHMTEKSRFFDDEHRNMNNNNGRHYESTTSVYTSSSTWSLNPSSHDQSGPTRSPARKTSFRNRLKGAFSFQNIRRAVSIDKLNDDESLSQRSVSHSYLNEFGEDISQLPAAKPKRKHSGTSLGSENLRKAPSISSIFSTVRMRKRKSRERRAAKARNTIAADPKQAPVHEEISHRERPNSIHGMAQERNDGVSHPGHFRPIGRILQMDARQGTLLVEMVKPPSGPYGFYLARKKGSGDHGSVYISSLSDSYPDKMYAGLMKLGDEITEMNGQAVNNLSLNQVYDIILDSNRLLLRIKPSQVHAV